MPQRLSDWRGNSNRFLEGETLVDTSLSKTLRLVKSCDVSGPNGSVECGYLSSARLRWLTFIAEHAVRQQSPNKGSAQFAQIGANLGLACYVTLGVTCRECSGRIKRWLRWPIVWIGELSLRSLEPKPEEGISTSWRVEISNELPSGR